MAQAPTIFAFLFYFLKDSKSLDLDKANKAYRARVTRNRSGKKKARMFVYTCFYDDPVKKHSRQEASLISLNWLVLGYAKLTLTT